MSTQKQDLVLFSDNSILSEDILSLEEPHLSVISSSQGTSPSWLINSLVENALVGTASQVNRDLLQRRANRTNTIVISFSRPLESYVKGCKRMGLDLGSEKNFEFIDCFSDLFSTHITNPNDSVSQVDKLFSQILDQINKSGHRKVIFLEAPEILLSATNISSYDMLKYCFHINKLCTQLFVISACDSPQIVSVLASLPKNPVYKITDFLIKLYHRSSLNISLQSLTTGRTDDITGRLTITRGCIPYINIPELQYTFVREQEYVYYLHKESNVDLYFL